MRHIISRLAVPAIAIALSGGLLAGCGGITSAATTEAGGSEVSAAAAPAAAPAERAAPAEKPVPAEKAVATNTVTIQNFAFSPATVTIKRGSTLTWTNQDQDPHTVSAMSGLFQSPTLNTGQSYHYTFTTPGRFEYLCTIHPFMTATVVMTPRAPRRNPSPRVGRRA